MAEKLYFTYDEIHELIGTKMKQIAEEFDPEVILAIGGGGFISGRVARTFHNRQLLSVTVKLYNNDDEGGRDDEPTVIQWLDEQNMEFIKNKRVLIVDEVDDSRITLSFVVQKILDQGVASVATLVIHNKQTKKIGKIPDNVKYYSCIDIEDRWIIYPWDAKDINDHNKKCKREEGWIEWLDNILKIDLFDLY